MLLPQQHQLQQHIHKSTPKYGTPKLRNSTNQRKEQDWMYVLAHSPLIDVIHLSLLIVLEKWRTAFFRAYC
jgi:hypothetical protein